MSYPRGCCGNRTLTCCVARKRTKHFVTAPRASIFQSQTYCMVLFTLSSVWRLKSGGIRTNDLLNCYSSDLPRESIPLARRPLKRPTGVTVTQLLILREKILRTVRPWQIWWFVWRTQSGSYRKFLRRNQGHFFRELLFPTLTILTYFCRHRGAGPIKNPTSATTVKKCSQST